MASSRLNVNVGDGFLPHFSPAFLDRYGPSFVHAASDHLTLRLAEIMDRAGELVNATDIALFSDDESVKQLRELLGMLEDGTKKLLSESCGSAPIGSFGKAVSERFGEGVFDRWLHAFRSGDFASCESLIGTSNGPKSL